MEVVNRVLILGDRFSTTGNHIGAGSGSRLALSYGPLGLLLPDCIVLAVFTAPTKDSVST